MRGVAELAAGLGEGGGPRQAGRFELVRAGLEVKVKLGVEVVIEAAAAGEVRERRWRSSVIMRSS